jgi:hypothetical protein
MVKQFSIFLENRPGRLANLVELMASNGINFKAMSIAEAGNYGIVRCIVDNDDKALAVMKDANMAVNVADVLLMELAGIGTIVKVFEREGINIDYAYSVEKGRIVIKVSDLHRALKVIEGAKIRIYAEI